MGNSSSSVEDKGKPSARKVPASEAIVLPAARTFIQPKRVSVKQYIQDDEHNIHDDEQYLSEDNFVENADSVRNIRTGFLKDLSGPLITLTLELDCEDKEERERIKELTVPKDILCLSVHKLKLCIEEQHNIPACSQTLTCGGNTLTDEELLHHYYIRDGDCLRVTFEGTTEVDSILEILDDIKNLLRKLKSWEVDLKRGNLCKATLLQISQENCYSSVHSLCAFYESNSRAEGRTSRLFLADSGAFVIVRKLHEELLKHHVSVLPVEFIMTESLILSFYWQLTADEFLYQFIRKSRVLQNISKSFMRVKVDRYKGIELLAPMLGDTNMIDWRRARVTKNVLFKAMGGLCNFTEKPGCGAKIASNRFIMDQLLAIVCCPNIDFFYRVITMGGIFCLSFSSATHQYLCSPPMFQVILENANTKSADATLIEYFAVITIAIILSTSPHLLSADDRRKVTDIFQHFFEKSNPARLREKEVMFGFLWLSVLPYMKLAYHPYQSTQQSLLSEENTLEIEMLNRDCIQCGIFSLSNVLQSKDTRDILVREGLLDYLVCMPWLYPPEWPEREKARELVSFMGQHVQLQPPSLINITKARLAATYFGLEKVLSSDVHQLFDEVFARNSHLD